MEEEIIVFVVIVVHNVHPIHWGVQDWTNNGIWKKEMSCNLVSIYVN